MGLLDVQVPEADILDVRLLVTERCCKEDLGGENPDEPTSELARRHPIVAKFVHLRSADPEGREPIKSIRAGLPIWSLHWNRYRGATCEDREQGVIWLLGFDIHRGGDRSDVYAKMVKLHAAGRLLPTAGDYERLIRLRNAQVIPAIIARTSAALMAARAEPEVPQTAVLPFGLVVTVLVEQIRTESDVTSVPGLEQIWMSINVDGLRPGWLEIIHAALVPGAEREGWSYCRDFPGRRRDSHELRFAHTHDLLE